MNKPGIVVVAFAMALIARSALPAVAADWLQWGRDASKNMASNERGLPATFDPGKIKGDSDQIDLATTKNVKWVVKLGSQAFGNPTVAGGRVFVGTNNESPRDRKHKGDRGVVMCFEEQTGKFLWQLIVPKLGAGKVSDWEYLGICSSPTVDDDRVYVVTNRGAVLCLDVQGMANGNDGPYTDEGRFMAGKGKPPITPGPTDADIIWRFDMRQELGVFPHNITSSSILVAGDALYVNTSNGVDWSHLNIPNPRAPTLVKLDKMTGQLLGEEASGIGGRLMHGNWSSAAYGKVGDQEMVIFGAGDGYCYAFDPKPVKDEEGFDVFKEIWRFDCNPHHYRFDKNGKRIRYPTPRGPSEVIATPVFYKGRVYVSIGQDPEHGDGMGSLSCIDATKSGDISKSGAIWTYQGISRAISTVSIADGLLYVADYAGFVHCVDADTGEPYWKHDTQAHIWGSTLVADGKVYIGNEDSILTILATGKKKKLIDEIEFDNKIYSSPIAANGVLYVATQSHLYAIESKSK